MTVFLLAIAAAVAALLGGALAIKGRKNLNYSLGFTAGIILGLIAFDLLPEIFKTVNHTDLSATWPMLALVSGFLLFHIVEKTILLHHSQEGKYGPHIHPYVGLASGVALLGHSFLDGAAIGVAYQVSTAVGAAVAVAVVSHRFADGFNTTNVMVHSRNSVQRAKRMLYAAAIMPILGALSANLFTFSEKSLAIYLGFFAGFLLYIGAADILPQAHSKGASRLTIGFTVLGTAFMFAVTRIS